MGEQNTGGSTYDIELIHRDSHGNTVPSEVVRMVGDLGLIIVRAEEMFLNINLVPRPNGYRIVGAGGEIVHEFWEHRS